MPEYKTISTTINCDYSNKTCYVDLTYQKLIVVVLPLFEEKLQISIVQTTTNVQQINVLFIHKNT